MKILASVITVAVLVAGILAWSTWRKKVTAAEHQQAQAQQLKKQQSEERKKAAEAAANGEPMADTAAPQTAGDAEANEGAAAQSTQDTAESSTALGVARCVQLDGVRYFESPAQIDFAANRDPDGVIADSVARDTFPETDGCSNFGAGYSYWITGEKSIVVEINREYLLFEAN